MKIYIIIQKVFLFLNYYNMTDNSVMTGREQPLCNRIMMPEASNQSPQWNRRLLDTEGAAETPAKKLLMMNKKGSSFKKPASTPKRISKFYSTIKAKQSAKIFFDKLKLNASIPQQDQLKNNILYQQEQSFIIQKKQNVLKYLEILQKCPLFQPQSIECKIFDLISFLITLISLWLYPFTYSFQIDTDNVQLIILVQTAFEIVFNCNRATYLEGNLIMDRKQILNIYIRERGLVDFLFLIINALIIYYYNHIWLQVITILLIMFRLHVKLKIYQDTLYAQGHIPELVDLISLLITIYYFAHITACLWYFVGSSTQEEYGSSWIIQKNFEDKSNLIKYNLAFYWATMTMTTIGYGDVTAQNPQEVLFSNFMMLFSSFIFAYTMNSMGAIIKNHYESNQQYNRSILILNTYMKNNQVSQNIQDRVRNYLKYYLIGKFNQNIQEVNNVTQSLPLSLQQELNQNIKMKIINQIPVFRTHFRFQTLQNITQKMQLIQYTPNEIIYHQNNQDSSLYFVLQGKVFLQEENSKLVLQTAYKGDTFGHYQFFTNFNPKSTAVSDGFIQICKISRDDFINCLKIQQEYQMFKNIQDQIQFNNDFRLTFHPCNLCKQFDHLNIHCQTINFKPNLEKIIKQDNFLTNPRRKIKRKQLKFNTFQNLTQIRDTVVVYTEQKTDQSLISPTNIHNQKDQDGDEIDQLSDISIERSISPKLSSKLRLLPQQKRSFFKLQNSDKPFSSKTITSQKRKTIIITKDNANKSPVILSLPLIKKTQETIIIDKIQSFITYFPHNNVDSILQQQNLQKISNRFKECFTQAGKYMFQYIPKQLAAKIIYKFRKWNYTI
ncbi:hypothetical protein pb186bvf_009547 [Paramecium bursaria]